MKLGMKNVGEVFNLADVGVEAFEILKSKIH